MLGGSRRDISTTVHVYQQCFHALTAAWSGSHCCEQVPPCCGTQNKDIVKEVSLETLDPDGSIRGDESRKHDNKPSLLFGIKRVPSIEKRNLELHYMTLHYMTLVYICTYMI